jgi:hypothetical protein
VHLQEGRHMAKKLLKETDYLIAWFIFFILNFIFGLIVIYSVTFVFNLVVTALGLNGSSLLYYGLQALIILISMPISYFFYRVTVALFIVKKLKAMIPDSAA